MTQMHESPLGSLAATVITGVLQHVLFLGASLLLGGAPATGHDSQPDWPTAEQLAAVKPALGDSVPLARKLVAGWRHRLNEGQSEQLDRVQHSLEMMQQISSGAMGKDRYQNSLGKMQLVEYYRWRMEVDLCGLLETLGGDGIVDVPLDKGSPNRIPESIIAVDGLQPHVILRVRSEVNDSKLEDTQMVLSEWDLTRERPEGPFTVDALSGATTFILLDLRGLPDGKTVSHLTIRDQTTRQPLYTCGLTFQSVPRGQLAIDVLNDQGHSVPVLMSIASHESGHLWEPAESVDMKVVLDDIVPHLSTPGKGYMFYLFGERRGRYWIVKPPLEMALPVGQWDIKILRGLEFSPVTQSVTVNANQWTRVKLEPKRWANMKQRGWYSGDDHVHARLDNSEDARKLLTYAKAVDINVANILEMGDAMRTYYSQRGFGQEFQVHDGDHWLVPGQEDPRSMLGHAIGLNLKSKVRDLDRYYDNHWVASEIHHQGGLYGHTHVGPNACFVHREMALFTPDEVVDFNSIMQATLGTDLYYDFLNLGFRMTASAGADTPYGGTMGAVRTYAYTGNPDRFEPNQWFDAVKEGRTFVTNGPMIELTVNDQLPGSEIQLEGQGSVTLKARAWGDQHGTRPVRMRLIQLGETLKEVIAEDANGSVLEMNLDFTSAFGGWVAIHVMAEDGSQAHTTPVYLKRAGFRHWNTEKADAIIERQLAVLREVEAEVKMAERLVLADGTRIDYANRQIAEQADSIRLKVNGARQFYEDLRMKLAKERQLRRLPIIGSN